MNQNVQSERRAPEQNSMDLDIFNSDEGNFHNNLALRLKYEKQNQNVVQSRHFKRYLHDQNLQSKSRSNRSSAQNSPVGNRSLFRLSNASVQLQQSSEEITLQAHQQAHTIYKELLQNSVQRHKDQYILIEKIQKPSQIGSNLQVISQNLSESSNVGLADGRQLKHYITSEQLRFEIAEYLHQSSKPEEELDIDERSINCLMTILQKKYKEWSTSSNLFIDKANTMSLIDSFAAKKHIEACQDQDHQDEESEEALLTKLVRFPPIKRQILKNIYTPDYLIRIFEEIIKLNIQQTSLNVLIQMSLKEKIQLLFQRAKTVIESYKLKVQQIKRIGKIVGTTNQPDINNFLSPNFKNRKHFNFGEKQERSVEPQNRVQQDLIVLNNGILGLLNLDSSSSPSSCQDSNNGQSREFNDSSNSGSKRFNSLQAFESPEPNVRQDYNALNTQNKEQPSLLQLKIMDIDNNSNSYNTPRRGADGAACRLSNQKSAKNPMITQRKQCLRVSYKQNERLAYDELEIRGLLTQYNCFETQNEFDDEEMDEMVGQVQTIYNDMKSSYVEQIEELDQNFQHQQIDVHQSKLETILLQLLHNSRIQNKKSVQQQAEIDQLKAELQKNLMDKEDMITLQQKQEFQEFEHREQSESKDQHINELINKVNELQKDWEVQQANMDRVQQTLNDERDQNQEEKKKLIDQKNQIISSTKMYQQEINELRAENNVLDTTLNDQLQQCKLLHIQIQEMEQSRAWQNQIYEELYKKHMLTQSTLQKEQANKDDMKKQITHLENVNKGLQIQVKELEQIQIENYDQQELQILSNPSYIIQENEQNQSVEFEDLENITIDPKLSSLNHQKAKNNQFHILDKLLNDSQINQDLSDNNNARSRRDSVNIRINNSFISNNQVENNLINELNNDDDILVDSVQSDGDIEKVDLDTFVRPPNESKITSKEISEDLLVAHSNSFNMIKTQDQRKSIELLQTEMQEKQSTTKLSGLSKSQNDDDLLKPPSRKATGIEKSKEIKAQRPSMKIKGTNPSQMGGADTISISERIDQHINELQRVILDKKLIYNIVCDSSLPEEQTFVKSPSEQSQIFEQINSLLQEYFTSNSNAIYIQKEAGGQQRSMYKTKASYLIKRDDISPNQQTNEFYLEKLHIWDRHSSKPLKQILMLIYRGSIFLMFVHKAILYMQPLSIFTDIEQIFACNMSHSKTKAGGNILFDVDNSQIDMCDRISMFESSQLGNSPSPRKTCQTAVNQLKSTRQYSFTNSKEKHRFICIQLKQPVVVDSDVKLSQIFLVQHNSDNIERLHNFINYHRLGICTKIEQYEPIQVSFISLDEKIAFPDDDEVAPVTFQMIQFDPDIIDLDNEAAFGQPKSRIKIYSDMFLTQKKSYFSLRTQMINCHCHLLVPTDKAMIVIKRCIQAEEQMDRGEQVQMDRFDETITQKIERIIIDSYGPNYRMQFEKKDQLSRQKAIYDLLKLFQFVLQFKIGHEDINKNKVSSCLVLNKSLKVTNVTSAQNNTENQKELSIELEQYYYCPDQKQSSSFGRRTSLSNLQKEAVDAGVFDLQQMNKKSTQKTILIKQSLFQKMVSTDRRYGQTNHNEAIFEKWENKLIELVKMPYFNEQKFKKESSFYLKSMHKIKSLISDLIKQQK